MTRNFILLFVAIFLGLALFQFNPQSLQALDKSGCEMDCQKCHTITNQAAKEILNNIKVPEGEVLKVELSPVKRLWEISFLNKGKPALIYVDFSKSFILPGPVVEIKGGKNKTQERVAKIQENRRVDFSRISLDRALVMGDILATHKVAVIDL